MPLYNPPQTPLSVTTKGDIQTFSTTPARLSVGSNGYYPIADSSQTTGLKYKAPDGWNEAFETWEYVSVDDPTGIFRVNVDVTAKYSAGMRIKFTNSGNVIKGIITVVSAYGAVNAGYTHITFLHEIDPTDSLALYLMANSAITANYYSCQKTPFGFPSELNKWTVYLKNTSEIIIANPTGNTWVNYSGLDIYIPIGNWRVSYQGNLGAQTISAQTLLRVQATLSTANNSESDVEFTTYIGQNGASATLTGLVQLYIEKNLSLTSKTRYYLNINDLIDNCANVYWVGNRSPTIIRAVCAYL